jgi:choice-of-anchor B domain-containing protein
MRYIIFSLFILTLLSCQNGNDDPGPDENPVNVMPVGHIQIPGTFKTDVWSYIDPQTDKEYALVGDHSGSGLTIVDVSDPSLPVIVANIDTIPGFDVKVWSHYAYVVNGGPSGFGYIVDITLPAAPQVVGSFPSAHNIFIDSSGFLYAEFLGLKIYNLQPDPTQPQLIWDGGSEGHDATVVGNRLYDFHGSVGTRIYDITDRTSPLLLGSITDPAIMYHHSGWVTKEGRYLFICDELATGAQPDVTVWDIQDPQNPEKIGSISDPLATVHNLYIVGDTAYVSYYAAGYREYDVSDPAQPRLIGYYDTNVSAQQGFSGAFGVYAFSPTGLVFVNDWDNGLFIFRKR